MTVHTIFNGDVLRGLREIEGGSVQSCVTSPPYWGLRDYGCDGQIGLEQTPEEYTQKLVDVFREVRRVLRDDGTLWLNLGDSYGSGSRKTQIPQSVANGNSQDLPLNNRGKQGYEKQLIGIPWRVAFALQADGWYLRSDIIWSKPNPMPESVTDRPTKAHEYIFLLSKSAKYYYDADAIREKAVWVENRPSGMVRNGPQYRDKVSGKYSEENNYGGGGTSFKGHSGNFKADGTPISGENRNKRTVWSITTQPFADAHFATFPEEIPTICIKAGTKPDDIVLDPFCGSGTVSFVARKLGRSSIGIELNRDYIKIIKNRLDVNQQLDTGLVEFVFRGV